MFALRGFVFFFQYVMGWKERTGIICLALTVGVLNWDARGILSKRKERDERSLGNGIQLTCVSLPEHG